METLSSTADGIRIELYKMPALDDAHAYHRLDWFRSAHVEVRQVQLYPETCNRMHEASLLKQDFDMRFSITAFNAAGAISFGFASAKETLEKVLELEEQRYDNILVTDDTGNDRS